jgi:hypothetical protein
MNCCAADHMHACEDMWSVHMHHVRLQLFLDLKDSVQQYRLDFRQGFSRFATPSMLVAATFAAAILRPLQAAHITSF